MIDLCEEYPEISNVMCGVNSAYCQRGAVSQDFFELTSIYYHRLKWVDHFKDVEDQILKSLPLFPRKKRIFTMIFSQKDSRERQSPPQAATAP